MKRGLIHVYFGEGKGKTTAAVGLALRALGSGMKVCFTQFLKNNNSGEIKSLLEFENLTLIKNKKNFDFFWKLSENERIELKKEVQERLHEINEIMQSSEFDMIVLDEILGAVEDGIIGEADLIKMLSKKNQSVEIVLTGRYADNKLIDICDYASQVLNVKHPYEKGIEARKGIEY